MMPIKDKSDNQELHQALYDREIALKESRENHLLLMETAMEMIITLDLDGNITYVNPYGLEISGYAKDEALGQNITTFLPDGDLFLQKKNMDRRHEGESNRYFYETVFVNKAKERIPVEASTALIKKSGRPHGVLLTARDVTDRKKTERALRESEENYRNVVENVSVGILVAQDGKLVFANAAIAENLGYAIEELLANVDPFTLIYEDDRDLVIEYHIKRIQNEDAPKTYPFRIVTQKGDIKWVESINVMIKWEGRPATLNFFTDIDERVQSEEKRRRLESRLQKIEKMEAIGTLAGGIAHEFNNALAAIVGCMDIMKMKLTNKNSYTRYTERIGEAIDRMTRLTDQLLGYARGGKYRSRTINVAQLINGTLPLVRHTIKPDITIESDPVPEDWVVEGDPPQLQMVISAILSNASEAITGEGIIKLNSTITHIEKNNAMDFPELKPGSYLVLRIIDTGKGMDEVARKRIFEPFFTTKLQGRGLGMAAAYGIIDNHEGSIAVDSKPEKGTTVSIFLPVTQTVETRQSLLKKRPVKGSGVILIIEDEEPFRKICREILEGLGYQVMEAATGKNAMAIMERHQGDIDLVILDMILPDMAGKDVYHAIRKQTPGMKVLLCSGYAVDGPAGEVLDAGADDFIQKPFTMAAISEKIQSLMRRPLK